jgi:hypothetical protein
MFESVREVIDLPFLSGLNGKKFKAVFLVLLLTHSLITDFLLYLFNQTRGRAYFRCAISPLLVAPCFDIRQNYKVYCVKSRKGKHAILWRIDSLTGGIA